MRAGLAVFVAALIVAPSAWAASGTFTSTATFASSDSLLNQIWAASVKTADDMVVPGPLIADASGRPCAFDAQYVILDGTVRDRCPYIGDLAVEGKTLLATTPAALPVLKNLLLWFGVNQHDDGAIPASPFDNGDSVLFDYNAYWIECLYDYFLYTGDGSLIQAVWTHVVRLIDQWYANHIGPNGLLLNNLGQADYAYIARHGQTIAYFNAGYVRALKMAAQLATWTGDKTDAADWRLRIPSVAKNFSSTFWDAKTGAFKDSPDGVVIHPQDGNVFAILAGLATSAQATSALKYLSHTTQRKWGDTIADSNGWDQPGLFGDETGERAYPFISYFDVVARFSAGRDATALDLIRREWGYMLHNGNLSTMWESIGPHGGPPPSNFGSPSLDAGWASGAAPALTGWVLGVTPALPGWQSFAAAPHPVDLTSAQGDIPIPQGMIHFAWSRQKKGWRAKVVSPVPGTVTLPGGKPVAVAAGTHIVTGGTHKG